MPVAHLQTGDKVRCNFCAVDDLLLYVPALPHLRLHPRDPEEAESSTAVWSSFTGERHAEADALRRNHPFSAIRPSPVGHMRRNRRPLTLRHPPGYASGVDGHLAEVASGRVGEAHKVEPGRPGNLGFAVLAG
jgi:hypothetical protein